MERVLPKSIDYTKILPLAVDSRARRRNFFPVNGQKFTDDGNNIIRIDIAAQAFLDTKHSYLRFKLTNNSGQSFGMDFGGGHGIIRRLRIEQAGNVLSDCNNYNKLMSAVILPSQGGVDSVAHRSLTEGVRFLNESANGASMTPAAQATAEISGALMNTPTNSDLIMLNGEHYVFSIPLINGLLGTTQDKMVPLQLLGSSPLTIEIELAPVLDIGIYTAAGIVAGNYEISDVRYIANLVEVGPEVDAQLRMVQELSGGKLVLNGIDYTHFNGNIGANATGNQVINVPARRKSMNALYFVGGSQQFAAPGAGGAERQLVYNMSFGGNFGMTDYQLKIGSVSYPPTPVDCQFGPGAGNVRGEALSELAKSWGSLGSTHGTGSLSTINYATTDCLVASIPTYGGVGAATTTHRFAPFAMDLQAFARTALESGVNSADASLPLSLIINVGVGINEAINVDAFVAYDSLYYIDSSGTIRVSL